MPTIAKPLFRPEALRPKLSTFIVPPTAVAARPQLANWVKLLGSKKAEAMKETELLGDFIADVFGRVLGYAGPAAGLVRYTIKREATVEVDGKFADAALGRFSTADNASEFVAAVEGKGPRDPLDRPFAGRKLSAVDQALRYAVNLECDWYLITNLHEIRLYHKGHDQFTFERFETAALADADAAFRRFVFLLAAERMVPTAGPCHLDGLMAESRRIGLDLTRDYYHDYADLRVKTFYRLRQCNSAAPPARLSSQKLQDVANLGPDALFDEVKKARGKKKPLTVADLKRLRAEHVQSILPLQALAAEARGLERQVAELVHAAYGLTAEEVALMWKTAPPRMPGEGPGA